MATPPPPTIFSAQRRLNVRARMRRLQARPDAARYLIDDMADDVLDRLSFLRHEPSRALVIGDWTGAVADALAKAGAPVERRDPVPADGERPLDEEHPFPGPAGFDFIASLSTLDTVNDLPGALVHLRRALAPGGLMIASFMAAGSLPTLRAIMLEADGDRPAPRIHPQVDVRAGGQLLQRSGFADPVVDSRTLSVRFGTLQRLVGDLREQGVGSCLANFGPALNKAAWARANAAFRTRGDGDARVTETFEILTLSGWAKVIPPSRF